MTETRGSGPLAGLMAVSLEQAVAAPLCSCRLADAGARVIKLERPEGDFARDYDRIAHGLCSYFVWLNRGKQSLVVDIKDAADRALVLRLLARADIFIQNLGPGAAARAGLDPKALVRRFPRLIACSISGYGAASSDRERKAYDLLVQAETGLAMLTGSPEAPSRVGVSVSDIAAGLNAYAAILEALFARERTGQGAAIEIALFDATAEWMAVPLIQLEHTGKAPPRVGLKHPSIAPYGAFTAGDGKEIILAIQNDREWVRFCDAFLGRPELGADPRMAKVPSRVAHRALVDGLVAEAFAREPRAAIAERLAAADIAFGNLNEVADFATHPALRRLVTPTSAGPISIPAPPARDPARPVGAVPALGEHSASIRAEFAQ